MYRKDVFEKKGLTMPAKPTWQQVADLAAEGGRRREGHEAASACAGCPAGAR